MKFLLLIFLLSSYSNTLSQIIFKELPDYEIRSNDSLFFDITRTRSIIPLNGTWNVYSADDEDRKKYPVQVPSIFQGKAELFFEKNFSLSEAQLSKNKIRLHFLGLNYTADILINNVIIYRHSGGEFPFKLDVPSDILRKNKQNTLSVKLNYELDSENSIPVKQRFLFPQNYGGILKDVYLQLMPNISITDLNIKYTYNAVSGVVKLNINSRIENKEFRKANDSLSPSNDFYFRTSILSKNGFPAGTAETSVNIPFNRERNLSQSIQISNPTVWSPSSPESYIVRTELWRGDNLMDISRRSISFFSLVNEKESLVLNNASFQVKGVIYIPSNFEYGCLSSYDRMERDIRTIKETGFNSVRFAKSVPHPYYLYLCEKYGLLAFIELPIQAIPVNLTEDLNFKTRTKNYLLNFLKGYRNYSVVAGIGLGNSYSPTSNGHKSFLEYIGGIAKSNINALTYASFSGFDLTPISNIDLYGVDLFNKSFAEYELALKDLQKEMGSGNIFISSATFVVNRGSSDGYVNTGTYEAQAKYFEELLDYADANPLSGYFINCMFDYRGDYNSLISGYTPDKVYHIGIATEGRDTDRITYKVISAKLLNTERVTIPIGNKKDNSPMIYIVFGLVLALVMGILVNSGRKFREDSSRALLRPYNFFADVRDQRIMSGPHTTLLAIVVSAIAALIVSNLLSYLKESVFFEKILLSFGSQNLMKFFSYLAWNPMFSLLWLTIAFGLILIIMTFIVKIASFFVRNRVYLSSVYFTVIWSFLPLVLLIPVGIVLYRLLNAGTANIYIYAGLLIFAIWIFYRLMKGIYVIFDINAASVYFYGILIFLFTVGGFVLYFELRNSVISYLSLTINQYTQGG